MIPLTQRLVSQDFHQRLVWIRIFFLLLVGIIIVRALHLQVVEHSRLEKIANRQGNSAVAIKLRRGPIFDTNNELLAVSLPMKSIFAIPREVDNPARTARQISNILNLPTDHIERKLKSDLSFTWLKRNTKPAISNRLERMSLPGVHSLVEYQRFYPLGNLAAHVIGFSGIDSQGLEGIEYSFNAHLMDNTGLPSFWDYLYKNPDPMTYSGGSVHLTIQSKLQYFTEKELRKAVYASDANNGVAIIMESQTGDILAMVNIPDYDPNNFDRYDSSRYFNRAVNATYEPGSTFKVITVATAVENEIVAKDAIFYCEEGAYQIQDRVIHDVAKHGWLPLEQIIQKSSNICAAKIGQRIPKSIFYKYIRDFGFGTVTGIDLPGEVSGKVHSYQNWSDTDVATISFGHTIAATPIQVITAINTIATGGYLVQPHIIKSVFKADGTQLFQKHSKGRKVIKKETAELINSFMQSVVQPGGTGYLAKLAETSVSGKTGTSRKFDQRKQEYSRSEHISSFIGFFPSEKPELTILVIMDEPQREYLGTRGAAPVFKKIAEHALRYYPETKQRLPSDDGEPMSQVSLFASEHRKVPSVKDTSSIPAVFRGLTLREALTLANEMGIQIKIKGAGRVSAVQLLNEKQRSYELVLR